MQSRQEVDELVVLAEGADEEMMEAIRSNDVLRYCAAAAVYLAVFGRLRQIQREVRARQSQIQDAKAAQFAGRVAAATKPKFEGLS